MSYDTHEIATKNLHRDIKGAFSDYRKRKVMIVDRGYDEVTIGHDPHWSGGSITYEAFFRRIGSSFVQISRDEAGVTTVRKRKDGTEIRGLAGPFLDTVLRDDVVCVETGYFCGKVSMMRIIGQRNAVARVYQEA